MNHGVLKQARTRAASASKKAYALRNSRSLDESQELWSEFLTEHHRFFLRLGNAMETAKEQGWFDRLSTKRKNEPVMSYLLHARNADEHGRELISYQQPPSWGTPIGQDIIINFALVNNGGLASADIVDPRTKAQVPVKFTPAFVAAVPVTDRGKVYPVPPSADLNVAELATIALHFIDAALHDLEDFQN